MSACQKCGTKTGWGMQHCDACWSILNGTPVPKAEPSLPPPQAGAVDVNPVQRIEVMMAVGLLVAFFMPWGRVFFFNGSGYDIATRIGGSAGLVWLIPMAAGSVIWAAYAGLDTRPFCRGSAFATLAALLWGLETLKGDLFKVMAVGAWLSLALGIALILFTLGIIKPLQTASREARRR